MTEALGSSSCLILVDKRETFNQCCYDDADCVSLLYSRCPQVSFKILGGNHPGHLVAPNFDMWIDLKIQQQILVRLLPVC